MIGAIYCHYHEDPCVHMVARHYGIRTQPYKPIRFCQFDEWESYDLQQDPDESTNRYGSEQYASEIAQLKQDLAELRKRYRDETDVSVMPAEWQRKHRPRVP